jgi:hypothetical protein
VALGEQRHDLGVEAGRHEDLRELEDLGPQLGRVLRDRDGVQVDDAVDGVVVVLFLDPAPHRTQVVAEVDLAGGLDAGEHTGHGRRW